MTNNTQHTSYLEQPFLLYFLIGLVLLNLLAVFKVDFLYIGALLAFLYIVITPGFLLLPFLTHKKFPPMLGITISAALSIFSLMVIGLLLNTVLPLVFNMQQPLTTLPLLLAFDLLVYVLLVFSYKYKKSSPFEFHEFTARNWVAVGASVLLPILACVGAMILNNGGSSTISMLMIGLVFISVPILLFYKDTFNPSVPPIVLYMIALSFLLMNSMRGLFISGHDILLEYHVFTLVNNAHLWNMDFYRDPYMACLSLTILPSYFQQLLHINSAYIFKFFMQIIGALPVVTVYYLTKEYVSDKLAFFAAFLYISFPTFMTDMAFLNRQGIAFLFFVSLLFTMLSTEHFKGWKRTFALFLFGIGIIISHYSTSYVAIAILMIAYSVNHMMRFIVTSKKPKWFSKFTTSWFSNKEMYAKPVLLTLPLVLGLLVCMVFWSSVVTKTSRSLFDTIRQIAINIQDPFSADGTAGPARYSLVRAKKATPQEIFDRYIKESVNQARVSEYPLDFYPPSLTKDYPAIAIGELPAPTTLLGDRLQSILPASLNDTYNFIKQTYAKIIQLFLFIGLIGLIFGYTFKKNVLQNVPVEYIALSIAGMAVMVGQTILPGSTIDYGLLRLFQQNLIFLTLPITLGLIWVSSFITKNTKVQVMLITGIILAFFLVLSGVLPQLTGGGRPLLPLANDGLYYDSYYSHGQEVSSIGWLSKNGDRKLTIQAAKFSDMKMLAFGQIGAYIELLPQTTKKRSYVYLNFDNVESGNILEIINGDVIYYKFPIDFLNNNKNLIYNNGGSKIYR